MRARATLDARALQGLVFLCALQSSAVVAAGAPPDPATPEAAELAKQAARAEVRAASEAFANDDYEQAIEHYEQAMQLLPAPKLHYNIGVCHQRLSIEAQDPQGRTLRRDLAIESYNAYLEQNPQAEDRLEVAGVIRELGGSPVTMPALKPLFEDSPETSEPGPAEPSDEATDHAAPLSSDPDPAIQTDPPPPEPRSPPPNSPPPEPPPPPTHGRFGINLLGGYSPTLARSAFLADGLFAAEFFGGGMLGRRRRFLLAAHTLLYGGATLATAALPLSGYSLGLLGQQNWVVGRDAVMLGVGGILALTGQSIGRRENNDVPDCRLDSTTQTASHTGGWLASRFELGVLIGARRRGVISLVVAPSIAVFAEGPRGEACTLETPWTALGVTQRWQFQLWAGAGFGFRF